MQNSKGSARWKNGSDLWEAANTGNTAKLKAILENGNVDIDFTAIDPMGRTPLIEAAKYNHSECVRLLLAHGANPSASSMIGTADTYTNNKDILKLLADARQGKRPALKPAAVIKPAAASPSTPLPVSTALPKGSTGKKKRRGRKKKKKNAGASQQPKQGACKVCGALPATPLRCSVCRAVNYCGVNCQRTDWPQHRTKCSPPPLEPANKTSSTKAPISFGGDSDDDYDEDGSDQDEMTQRMNNHGFTNDEVMELLSQGVKPWDEDAWDVLDALNGGGLDDSDDEFDKGSAGSWESQLDEAAEPDDIPHQTLEQILAFPKKLPLVLMFTFKDPNHLQMDFYQPFLKTLASVCELATVKELEIAEKLLAPSMRRPQAIVLPSPGIFKKAYYPIAMKIVKYCSEGGVAVFCAAGPCNVRPPDLNNFFKDPAFKKLGKWTFGSYERSPFVLNPSSYLAQRAKAMGIKLPQKYNMKAVHLRNVVDPKAHAYVMGDEGDESPAVFAPFGSGWLGWVGDVNAEDELATVVLAMCGIKPPASLPK